LEKEGQPSATHLYKEKRENKTSLTKKNNGEGKNCCLEEGSLAIVGSVDWGGTGGGQGEGTILKGVQEKRNSDGN